MWIVTGLFAFILFYYSGFTRFFVGGDDIWLYMSAPGDWERVRELFADIGGTYRPIPFSLFAIYHLFDSNIQAMHWVPIVLHTANVVLVYLLARKVSGSKFGAIVGSVVYGVSHIVFFDVFTLTGLVDQVFLLFGLGSILAILRLFESSKYYRRWLLVSWGLFILTMLSKESFVSVLLVMSYFLWQKRATWKTWALYWIPTVFYFVSKLLLYRQQGEAYSYIINLPTLGRNLFDYGLWLINWRHGWQMGMPYPPHPYYDLVSVLSAGLLGFAAWNTWRTKRKIFWLGLWWGAVGLLPFYFLGRALPFYLEFSLIGIIIVIASGINKKWLLGMVFVGLAIYMSLTTKLQWTEYSFSARGVQAAEKFRDQVIMQYDWNQYDTLCLTGMGEYELWATGVGQLVNLVGNEVQILLDQECNNEKTLNIMYSNEEYHL